MVGKPVSERTRSKKSSNLVNGKIKSPKKVETTPARVGCTAKVTKKKSRKSEEPDIATIPSSIHESDYSDDDVKFIDEVEVEIDEKSQKREKNGEKNRGTKKGLEKNKAIDTLYSEVKPEKKKKKKKKGEGKKEEKKKKKKVGDEDVVLLEERNVTAAMKKQSNNEGKKEDKKLKGKEVKAKSPEKSKKGNGVSKQIEGKKDDKEKVGKEKEYTGKRRNETVLAEGKNDIRNKKVEGQKERTVKRKSENEDTKEKNKKRKTEVEEVKKQMKERGKQLKEGAKKEKQQKKVVVEVEPKKEDKKVKKKQKKNKEEESNVLYQFPMAQVSRIIKSEDFNSKIAHEAVFVINKAAEKFLELFCREAYSCAFLDHRNQVSYNHLASVVSKRRRFDFLSDFVPEKVKAEYALAEMSKAEAEIESETT